SCHCDIMNWAPRNRDSSAGPHWLRGRSPVLRIASCVPRVFRLRIIPSVGLVRQAVVSPLDIQPIPVSIAHKLSRGGSSKIGPNYQRGGIRIFREYSATGSDGGVVVHVSGNG